MATTWGREPFDSALEDREVRFGYLDAAAHASGFLALYSGRTRSSHPGEANYGSEIHGFTWDGGLEQVHHLDRDVIAIAWSEPDRRLYAIAHDPIPAILVYRLPRSRGAGSQHSVGSRRFLTPVVTPEARAALPD